MAKKILYVEDDEDTRDMVKMILGGEGFDVDTALNGKEGLDKLEKNGFNLALLDIMLPDMSGWDLFQKIKKNEGLKDVKVIFLSVIAVSEERKEILQKAGVSDYITKPFDNDDLVKRIKAILD